MGDEYFPHFESDYDPDHSHTFKIAEVDNEQPIEDEDGNEGRNIYLAEENSWFDCFWSEVYQIFVYALA